MKDLDFQVYISTKIRMIKNFIFYVHARRNRHKGMSLYRISLPTSPLSSKPTLTIYSGMHFHEYSMIYSLTHKEFFLELWLLPLTEFTIRLKGKSLIHPDFPLRKSSTNSIIHYVNRPIVGRIREFDHFFNFSKLTEPSLRLQSYVMSAGKSQINEDAFFVLDNAIGIADGVGQLIHDFGISSRDFSSELMQLCKQKFAGHKEEVSNKEIVTSALKEMDNGGCATYVIASLYRNRLKISNMGDCGLLLYRRVHNSPKLVFQTTSKRYGANIPYQVSKGFSPTQLKNMISPCKHVKTIGDTIKIDSDEYTISTHSGDILIAGSDGLFDNVFTAEIRKIIKKHSILQPERILADIFALAISRARGSEETPFQQMMAMNNKLWKGGKIDDITVMVSVLQP